MQTNEAHTPTPCLWLEEYGDDEYQTSCGKAFILNDGTLEQNDMRFCCFCGKPIREEIVVANPEEEEEEG